MQPPPMSQEKDTALGNVLEMLGLAEVNSNLTRGLSCKPEKSMNEMKDVHPNMANSLPMSMAQTLQKPESKRHSENTPDAQYMSARKLQNNISALSSAIEDGTDSAPLYQDLPDIQSNNDPSSWNWQLGTDTFLPSSPYMHNFLTPSSPRGPLRSMLGELPEPLEPIVADDDRTLVDESGSPEDVEGLIDELSDRVGTLQIKPGGQTQFYGPTSTFNLADMLAAANSGTHLTAQNDALECLRRLGNHKSVPAPLEEHLTNLYFSWQNPPFHVVDRKTYEDAKARWYALGDTPYYSESLRNAM